MTSITMISHGETITFEKNHSQSDEWRVRSSRNSGGKTNLTSSEVNEQVEYLKSRGFEQK